MEPIRSIHIPEVKSRHSCAYPITSLPDIVMAHSPLFGKEVFWMQNLDICFVYFRRFDKLVMIESGKVTTLNSNLRFYLRNVIEV